MSDLPLLCKLHGPDAFSALVRAASPDAALLYAFVAAQDGRATLAEATQALPLDSEACKRAADVLCVFGLCSMGSTAPPPDDARDISPDDLLSMRRGDAAFSGLCQYFESATGRILTPSNMRTLYTIYDTLSLPAQVLVLLINDCKQAGNLSVRALERRAYDWHDRGIVDFATAEAHLAHTKKVAQRGAAIMRLFGMDGRRPSLSEQRFLSAWIKAGFSDALILAAYDRTVMRLGKMQWGYVNSILESWQKLDIQTPDDIATKDAPGATPKRPKKPTNQPVEQAVLAQYAARRTEREQTLKQRLQDLCALSPDFAETEKELRLCASKLARATDATRATLQERRQMLQSHRQALLAQLQKPADYLSDLPDCALCGDLGYSGTTPCSCFVAACRAEQARRTPAPEPAPV